MTDLKFEGLKIEVIGDKVLVCTKCKCSYTVNPAEYGTISCPNCNTILVE